MVIGQDEKLKKTGKVNSEDSKKHYLEYSYLRRLVSHT